MGKSIRSKGMRANRAVRRYFKLGTWKESPVVDFWEFPYLLLFAVCRNLFLSSLKQQLDSWHFWFYLIFKIITKNRELIYGPKEAERIEKLSQIGKVENLKTAEIVESLNSEDEKEVEMKAENVVLTKIQKERLFLSRNQFKKKMRARSRSVSKKRRN